MTYLKGISMKHLLPLLGAVALSACTVDMTRFDREAELQRVGAVSAPQAPVSIAVETMSSDGNPLAMFGVKGTQDLTLTAKPVITETLNGAGYTTRLSGTSATVTAQIKPTGRFQVADYDFLFWKNFGMNMAFIGLFRDYYDVRTNFIVNYQVHDQGQLVWEKQYARSEKVAYSLSNFNFARHKILNERAHELFQVELTRATAEFAADFASSNVALSGAPAPRPVAVAPSYAPPVSTPAPRPIAPTPPVAPPAPATQQLTAAPSAPLAAGQHRTVVKPIQVSARPLSNGGGQEPIPAHATVKVGGSTTNAGGVWWFLSTSNASGWIHESQIGAALR